MQGFESHQYECIDGPNDGGCIWTECQPLGGDIYQDTRGHRYVFCAYFETWAYVGRMENTYHVRFHGAARTEQQTN